MTSSLQTLRDTLQGKIGEVLFGAEDAVDALVLALVARGHVLLQGVPGVGKTLLAKTLADLLGGEFKRVQGTPDLMPTDIIGVHILERDSSSFKFSPGPLFTDVLLFDEVNRTGPKTQSALLQAMEERKVSIDREEFDLSDDFFVIATQNPHEFEGTYPLPESQLDRFLVRMNMTYPERSAEARVLAAYDKPLRATHNSERSLDQAVTPELLRAAREEASEATITESVYAYAMDLAEASRTHSRLSLGLSTRGLLAMVRCARVAAVVNGRDHVTPDDLQQVAPLTMPHRLLLTPEAALEDLSSTALVAQLLQDVAVPR